MVSSIFNVVMRTIRWITLLWDNSLSIFSMSIIFALLAIVNHSVAYLLPLCIAIDFTVLFYAIRKNYKATLVEMRNDETLFENLYEVNHEQETIFLNEIRNSWQFKAANRFGKKEIISFISESIESHNQAYAFYSDESVILLQKNYDIENDIDKFRWVHEMAHSCWHTMIDLNHVTSRTQIFLLTLLIVISAIVLQSCWLIIIGELLCFVLFRIKNSLEIDNRKEMGADTMALSIFYILYGAKRAEKVSRACTNIYYSELLHVKNEKDWKRYLNLILNLLRFSCKEDQEKFITKVKGQISKYNKDRSVKGEYQRVKLKALTLSFCGRRFRQLNLSNEIFLTLNPPLYYFTIIVFMFLVYASLSKALIGVVVPWWCLFLVFIPGIWLFGIISKLGDLTCQKHDFMDSINNQDNGNEDN